MKSELTEHSQRNVRRRITWRERLVRVLERMFAHKRFPLIMAGVAVVLTLPSLSVGWVADDYYQRARMADAEFIPGISGEPWKFFDFATPESIAWAIDIGAWPWWTYPELRAAFWRPLTVATHWIDYQLWPEHPVIMHAHSLLWFGALIACVAVLYRRFESGVWVAGLAAFFYALDDARAMPVGFLANRNAIIATLFGVLAILCHDRWRREGSRAAGWLAPISLLLGLLSAEAGIGALAYLVAYSVFLDRGSIVKRFLVLVPSLVVVAAWRFAWSLQGYGVSGVGPYVDPMGEPVRFVTEALTKAPVLLLGQWLLPPSEAYMLAWDLGYLAIYAAVAAVVLVAIAWWLWPVLRTNALARFWALGMVLSLVPICATFPADRLLFFVGLGAFALLAAVLSGQRNGDVWATCRESRPLGRRVAKTMAIGMIAVHGFVAPLGLAVRSAIPVGPPSLVERLQVHVPMGDEVADQSVVIVNAPLPILAGYLPIRRAFDGEAVPRHTRVLAANDRPLDIERIDDSTLAVRPHHGFLFMAFDRLARNGNHPFRVGDQVVLKDMTATITALNDSDRPSEVEFRFNSVLESPTHHWLYWTGETYDSFVLPAVGEMRVLAVEGDEGR